MYTKILISKDKTDQARAIVLRSHHRSAVLKRSPKPGPRKESEYGSKAYNDAMQRAFNRAKAQIFFNPDMIYFVTLTYEGIEADYQKVMADVKDFVRKERRYKDSIDDPTPLKYAYVMEWQKRGSLHVHMITNKILTYTNQNGYQSVTNWRHGIVTSCLTIKNFDSNFKPYLYLFKYMRKAERIGKTFIHTSRNLNNFDHAKNAINLLDWTTTTQEYAYTKIPSNTGRQKTLKFYRTYLKYDMLESRKAKLKEKDGYKLWQKVLLHSTRVNQRKQVNHFQH